MATIQFFRGVDEIVVPEIRLSRSKDGRTGQAKFIFEQAQALLTDTMGEITCMLLIDEEGELTSREIKARFINGSPSAIVAIYFWRSETEYERFMRFAQRYADSHGLGYSDTSGQNK